MQAAAPLHVHAPDVHVFVVPVQFASLLQPAQPLAVQVVPPLQEPLPLQVQAPALQTLVEPVQSALLQQFALGMQVPTHGFWPLGQAQPDEVQV